MQPHEFNKLWDGHRWRKENREDELAYFTACNMSVHTKKNVNPGDLVKPLRLETKKHRSKKTDAEHLKKVFGLKS